MNFWYQDDKVLILTPNEVRNFKIFGDRIIPNIPEVDSSTATRIQKIIGGGNARLIYTAIQIARLATLKLSSTYDVHTGVDYEIPNPILPPEIMKDNRLSGMLEGYTLSLLRCFGWNVKYHETKPNTLVFAGQEALDPEDIEELLRIKIEGYAQQARTIIYQGKLKREVQFSDARLKLCNTEITDLDMPLIVQRLRELLGPKWKLDHDKMYTNFTITKTTS
jgi:hypothetical protein